MKNYIVFALALAIVGVGLAPAASAAGPDGVDCTDRASEPCPVAVDGLDVSTQEGEVAVHYHTCGPGHYIEVHAGPVTARTVCFVI